MLTLLAGCARGSSEGSDEPLGTINGSVVLAPTCPVETTESPCPGRPLAGVPVRLVDADGNELARAVSGDDGAFTIDVAPGSYLLTASIEEDPARFGEAGPGGGASGRGRTCGRAGGQRHPLIGVSAEANPGATIAQGSGRRETRGPRGVSRVRRFSKGAHPLATDPGSPYRRLVRGPAIYVLVALAAIWLFLVFANRGATSDQLSFSEFQSEVAAGNVDTANFLLGEGVIEGELSDGTAYRVAYVREPRRR
jgi:hypothetical protein